MVSLRLRAVADRVADALSALSPADDAGLRLASDMRAVLEPIRAIALRLLADLAVLHRVGAVASLVQP